MDLVLSVYKLYTKYVLYVGVSILLGCCCTRGVQCIGPVVHMNPCCAQPYSIVTEGGIICHRKGVQRHTPKLINLTVYNHVGRRENGRMVDTGE